MRQDPKNNPNIKLGDVELPDGFDDKSNEKLRITTWIDGDIYDELNKRAKAGEGKGKYQTLMNELLRKVLFETEPGTQISNEKMQAIATDLFHYFKQAGLVPSDTQITRKKEDLVSHQLKRTPQVFHSGGRMATKKRASHR